MKRKEKATDFKSNDLPKNRKALFFDVIRLQWRRLLLLGIILLLSLLPLLACLFVRDNMMLSLAVRLSNGELTNEQYLKTGKLIYLIASCCLFLLLFVSSVPLAGSIRIIRQLAYEEPVFFHEDFALGIKNNYKSLSFSSLLAGIMLILNSLMNYVTDNQLLQGFPIGIFIAFIVPPLMLTVSQASIYQGSIKRFFNNAILMYFKNAPLVLLFTTILLLPLILLFIENSLIFKYIALVVAVLFFLPLFMLLYCLFSNSLFDKYINKENYPEMYRKGLAPEEKQ